MILNVLDITLPEKMVGWDRLDHMSESLLSPNVEEHLNGINFVSYSGIRPLEKTYRSF